MFEYQTAICELTGLPVSNASVYEGPSAVGRRRLRGQARRRPAAGSSSPRGVHPHSRETLRTLARGWDMEVVEAPLRDGVTELPELDDDVSAVIVQQPNFLGAVEDLEALAAPPTTPARCAICACDPLPLALLRSPGECGVDIAVGEGQTLGNRLDFGGPSFGFFAATEALMRRMPGPDRRRDPRRRRQARVRAHAADARAAHPPREGDLQHLHRPGAERAGRRDLPELARPAGDRRAGRADAAAHRLRARAAGRRSTACRLLHEQPVVREFALTLDAPVERVDRALPASGASTPAIRCGRDYPEHADGLLVAITEQRTRADIDRLAEVLGQAVAAERSPAYQEVGRSDACRRRRRADDLRALQARPPGVRRAGARRARAPARRAAGARAAPRRAAAPARGLRARDRAPLQPALEAQLRPRHRLLPARLVHDEAQPQAPRAGRRAARPRQAAPAPGPAPRPGRARADVAPAGRAGGDRRPAPRLAAALGGIARRAGRRAADARLPRGSRRAPDQGADARHRPRHQPGDGDDGRLRGRQGRHRRARQRRPRRPARQGRPTTSPA